MAEGAPLLREYGLIAHRGFESLPLRQLSQKNQIKSSVCKQFSFLFFKLYAGLYTHELYNLFFVNPALYFIEFPADTLAAQTYPFRERVLLFKSPKCRS